MAEHHIHNTCLIISSMIHVKL